MTRRAKLAVAAAALVMILAAAAPHEAKAQRFSVYFGNGYYGGYPGSYYGYPRGGYGAYYGNFPGYAYPQGIPVPPRTYYAYPYSYYYGRPQVFAPPPVYYGPRYRYYW